MFGVVLWSDTEKSSAVILCEDHGDLAFYQDTDTAEDFLLDAGDLIEFDLTMDRQFRYAQNPQRVVGNHCPGLADKLHDMSMSNVTEARQDRASASIIPFNKPRRVSDAQYQPRRSNA